MTEVVEFDGYESEDNNVVALGDEKASTKISFQLAQDFYNEITGKSERLRELYSDPFVLKLAHVEQLHHRLEQSTEQYNVCSFHETYSVNYIDDSSERFSSLERLKLHVGSRGTAVEEVIIKYNILIILPKTSRPQEYIISIRMASRVAKIETMRKQLDSVPFNIPLYQMETAKAASFAIEYVDSTVANALMSVIKSWFNTVDRNAIPSAVKIARKFSHFAPRLTKYSLLSLICYYVYVFSDKILIENINTKIAVIFSLASVLLAYLSIRIGSFFGNRIEYNLDSIYEQSYINFSGADENYVLESATKIKNSKLKAAAHFVTTIIIGIGCSLIANWIGT
ncbi:hypothetical protein [Thalassotalea agariperforans]